MIYRQLKTDHAYNLVAWAEHNNVNYDLIPAKFGYMELGLEWWPDNWRNFGE